MMREKTITGGFAAALLLLTLLLAPAAMAQDTAEQPAAVTVEPGLLERLGVDIKPSAKLSVEELQARIDKLTAALKQGELTDDSKKQLRAQLKADRKELKQRQAAAAAQPAEGAAEQPASTPTPAAEATEKPAATVVEEPAATVVKQPAQTTEETAPQAAEPPAKPTTEQPQEQTAEQPAATAEQPTAAAGKQPAVPAVEEKPVATPAAPAAETTAEQPAAADQPAAQAATSQPAATPNVDAPPKVSPAAETKAAALLADKTPAESLSDEMLKARVEQYRDLLGEAELSRKTAKALRQRLKVDRETLRARVAAQEAVQAKAQAAAAQQQQEQQVQPTPEQTQQTQTQKTQPATTQDQQSKKQEQQATAAQPAVTAAPQKAPLEIAPLLPMVIAPTSQEIPLILEDRRPAQALADDELNRRILAARGALQDEQDFSQEDLTLFDRQVRTDRMELNNRLLADRNQRAGIYEQYERANDLDVDINTEPDLGGPQAPNSIFAAEVDDEEMWDQLVAAPIEPIKRRYSRHAVVEEPEFVMNLPEVREAMPSIELDTITFGFNEAFVREEEIFDLDRIARMIERVVAAHPDELFMIEGHTDAVGSDTYNLRLSRQRAQAVKEALTRYYVIAPENLATVGLGERYLKIWTPEAEEENRRVTVRRVTPLVTGYEMEE
jgi:outer membrane protein OmpA-like peptidoglycan-associated protein